MNDHYARITPAGPNGSGTVLVVDDDPNIVDTIKLILQNMGDYHVITADTGPECLRQVGEELPVLILLDYFLPGLNGLDVLRKLRTRPGTQDVPVLIVSVDAQLERMVACLEAGANGFLIKPFDAANLYQQVRSTIARHRAMMLNKYPTH